ncbi:MAG TPA: hypothetical protein EYQ31_04300, partial [Candidatus Handelsmanbacteria bacterium]|nr:hypothetical protein [Candidatus Handelsmanbacteria bacterium]
MIEPSSITGSQCLGVPIAPDIEDGSGGGGGSGVGVGCGARCKNEIIDIVGVTFGRILVEPLRWQNVGGNPGARRAIGEFDVYQNVQNWDRGEGCHPITEGHASTHIAHIVGHITHRQTL